MARLPLGASNHYQGSAEMSAKVVVCSMVVVCLTASLAVTYPSSEYLELVSVEEMFDDAGAIFSGTIRNTHHAQALQSVQVRLTLKKDDKVIYVEEKRLDNIEPGGTISFTIETLFSADEYDEFYLMPAGWEDAPTNKQIIAACAKAGIDDCRVDIVGVNLISDRAYAEIYNGTAATLDVQTIALELLDARGNRVGFAVTPKYSILLTLFPYEKVGFSMAYVDLIVSYDKIADWRVYGMEVGFSEIIATSVEDKAWGQIKAIGRR